MLNKYYLYRWDRCIATINIALMTEQATQELLDLGYIILFGRKQK
jgi:hypothetical protein